MTALTLDAMIPEKVFVPPVWHTTELTNRRYYDGTAILLPPTSSSQRLDVEMCWHLHTRKSAVVS